MVSPWMRWFFPALPRARDYPPADLPRRLSLVPRVTEPPVNLKRFLKEKLREKEDRKIEPAPASLRGLSRQGVWLLGFGERSARGTAVSPALLKKVFDAVFFAAAMQIPSLLQIEAECHCGALAQRIGPISDDTLGYSLERQSPEAVFALSCEIARRLKRNGVLRSDWSRGLVVGAVDGIEICSSFARCCDACMEREVQHKVNGEMQTDIQYYHRIVVVVLVSKSSLFPWLSAFRRTAKARWPAPWLCARPGRAVGPPLPGCVGGGRSVSASPLRSRSGTSGSGLGLHFEREPARLIARGGASHPGISHRRSGGTGPGDSILALAGPRSAGR